MKLRLHVSSLSHLWVSISLIRDYAIGLNIIVLRIAGFLDFLHRPVFEKLENTQRLGKWICFRTQAREKDIYSVGSVRKS
jgi:hypothetical protein